MMNTNLSLPRMQQSPYFGKFILAGGKNEGFIVRGGEIKARCESSSKDNRSIEVVAPGIKKGITIYLNRSEKEDLAMQEAGEKVEEKFFGDAQS